METIIIKGTVASHRLGELLDRAIDQTRTARINAGSKCDIDACLDITHISTTLNLIKLQIKLEEIANVT